MNVIMESLGDPIWQIGGGILLLAALVLILALRSPETYLSPWHQWLWTRIMLLVCLSLFLTLSAGVVLFHGANAASPALPHVTWPITATASPHGGTSPTSTPLTSPSPTPFTRLNPRPSPPLTPFRDPHDQQQHHTP